MSLALSHRQQMFALLITALFAAGNGVAVSLGLWWLVGLSGAILLTPVILGNTHWLLRGIAFLAPFSRGIPLISGAAFDAIRDIWFLAFLFIGALIILADSKVVADLKRRSEVRYLLLFLLILLTGVLFSPTLVPSAVVWLRALQVVVFFCVLLALVKDKDELWSFLNAFLLGHLVSASFLLLATASPVFSDTIGLGGLDARGLSHARTGFANTTAHVFPIALVGLTLGHKRWRPFYFIAVLVLVLSAYLSGGRAGLLALIIVSALLAWKLTSSQPILRKLSPLALGIIIVFSVSTGGMTETALEDTLLYNTFVRPSEWLFQTDGLEQVDRLTSYRFSSTLYAIGLMQRYPLTGVGLGNYRNLAEEARAFVLERGVTGSTIASSAHNLYLNVGSEAGILAGMLLFSFMLWIVWRAVWALQNGQSDQYIIITCGLVVVAQFITSFFEVEVFWSIYRAFPFWLAVVGLTKFKSSDE